MLVPVLPYETMRPLPATPSEQNSFIHEEVELSKNDDPNVKEVEPVHQLYQYQHIIYNFNVLLTCNESLKFALISQSVLSQYY